MKKTYENQKIRIFWEPGKCAHSANCLRGLPQVFNARKRPWIDIEAAVAEDIKKCIDTCPSGALSCELLEEENTSKSESPSPKSRSSSPQA